jgi:hypothetical protein
MTIELDRFLGDKPVQARARCGCLQRVAPRCQLSV